MPLVFLSLGSNFSSMKRSFIWVLLVGGLLLWRCDLFSTRTPEPPSEGGDPYAWIPPTEPDMVLSAITRAFRGLHKEDYLNLLAAPSDTSPGFVFVPDPQVAQQQGNLFENWGTGEEEAFIHNLFQQLDPQADQLFTWEHTRTEGGTQEYTLVTDYHLDLVYTGLRETLPTEMAGRAELSVRLGPGNYYQIYTWRDIGADSVASFSALKAYLH